MKMKQKIMAVVLAVIMILSFIPATALAAGSYTVSLSYAAGNVVAGDTFTIDVVVSSTDPTDTLAALQTNIVFDDSKVDFISVTQTAEMKDAKYNKTTSVLSVFGDATTVGVDCITVATLTFKARTGIVGDAVFSINGTPLIGITGQKAEKPIGTGNGVTVKIVAALAPLRDIGIRFPTNNNTNAITYFTYDLYVNKVKIAAEKTGSIDGELFSNAIREGDFVEVLFKTSDSAYGLTTPGVRTSPDSVVYSGGTNYNSRVFENNRLYFTVPSGHVGIVVTSYPFHTYKIADDIKNGVLTAEPSGVSNSSTTITATAVPENGYTLKSISYSANGSAWTSVPGASITNNKATFTINVNNTIIKAEFEHNGTNITISNITELFDFAEIVNSGDSFAGVTVTLDNDISITEAWTSIGTETYPFRGVFEGNGKTISGLDNGLFGYIVNATIQDLSVHGTINSKERIGGIACSATDSSVISNCGSYIEYINCLYVGGIVRSIGIGTQILNCTNYGDISGGESGGIAYGISGGVIRNSINYGSLSGTRDGLTGMAGLVYQSSGTVTSTIERCANKGTISQISGVGAENSSAGILAFMQNNSPVAIVDCYNTGNITAYAVAKERDSEPYVAGIVARINSSGVLITNCYNTGILSKTGTPALSGTVSRYGEITPTNNINGNRITEWIDEPIDPSFFTIRNCYTASEMAAMSSPSAAASALGSAYQADNAGVNPGKTPLLLWESGTVDSTEYTITFDFGGVTGATVIVYKDSSKTTSFTANANGTYSLPRGRYPYEVKAAGHVDTAGVVDVVSVNKTVNVTLYRSIDLTLTVTPVTSTVVITDVDTLMTSTLISSNNGKLVYQLLVGKTYEYAVTLSGYTSQTGIIEAKADNIALSITLEKINGDGENVDDTVYGDKTPGQSGKNIIDKEGVYFVGAGSTGTININTTGAVTLVGTGISSADMFKDLTIDCVAGANLTLRNLYIQNNVGQGTPAGDDVNMGYYIINFKGSNNSLNFEGINLLENQEYVKAAGIHVPKGASLTIGAYSSGTLYMYKYSQGAGIGGNTDEACGAITFSGGNIFIKGSKTGPLIGGDATNATNDPITISGGTINLVNKAQGAAIGSSSAGNCAGTVNITGGTLTIISDFTGSAIGHGGANKSGAGNLYVTGGTFKAVRTGNSINQKGDSETQTVDDSLITANKGNLRLLILDKTYTGGGSVRIDGYGTVYAGHDYRYSDSTSTMSNWRYADDDSVYVYLDYTKTYTMTTSANKTFEIKWDSSKNAFTLIDEDGNKTGGGAVDNSAITKEFGDDNVPLSNDPELLIIIEPEATNSNGTSTAKVTSDEVNDAIEAAGEFNKFGIGIAPTGIPENTKKITIELPKSSVKAISDAELSLVINTPLGNLTFEGDAVTAIVSGAGSGDTVQIIIEAVDTSMLTDAQKKAVGDSIVIDLTVMSGGKVVTSFGDRIVVTIPYELKNGEDPAGLRVFYLADDGTLTEIACTYNRSISSVIFILTHFSKYTIMYDASSVWTNPFSDVKESDWFYEAVKFVSSQGLMNGTSATTFAPDANLTRAMLVTVLYRYEKEPNVTGNGGFTDVPSGEWYTDAVAWAAANGIVNGVGDNKFNPNGNITREELATILYRYSKFKGENPKADGDLSVYLDGAKTSGWAADGVKWAVGSGIITGTSETTVDPQGTATRAQVATMLMRYIKK